MSEEKRSSVYPADIISTLTPSVPSQGFRGMFSNARRWTTLCSGPAWPPGPGLQPDL